MTKIVQIQYSTESGGSAALRLQRAFVKVDVQSSIVSLLSSMPGLPNIKYLGAKAKFLSRLDNKLQPRLTRNTRKELGFFSYPILGSNIAKIDEIKNADIIYIHWALNGFLNFNSIREIVKLKKPVIIFLHDMWFITGGCHHSFNCENYKSNGCHNCPMFVATKKNGLPARGFDKKRKIYAKYDNLYFVSPSKWLYNCAKDALLTKDKPVFYIPNILDNQLFKPIDKKIAKQILNIEPTETVIAFGAVSVNSPYKGWAYLQKALEILHSRFSEKNISVVIFGSGYNKQIAEAIPFKTKFMGYLSDEYSTSLVYNAADVFIAPSLAEAFGYVLMEALSCGTAVVGFNVGGIPDLIEHKKNGYLAKYKDANDIAEGIMYCLQNNIKGSLPATLEPSLTIQKHLDLFEHIKSKDSAKQF